jgi:hypothetical protein
MNSRVAAAPIGMVLVAVLAERARQPGGGQRGDLGVQHDVEIGVADARQVGRRGAKRRDDVDVHPQLRQQAADLAQVVAVAKAECRRAEDVAAWPFTGGTCAARVAGAGQRAHHLVKGFRRAPVLFALVRRQLQRDHRNRQVQRLAQTTRVVLDQLGGARGADHHGLRLEAVERIARGVLEQLGGVAAQIACLEGGVGDGRALGVALDHGEQQVGVGVALRSVQHVVHTLHRSGDAHRADVRRAFISPQGQPHDQATSFMRRTSGRANNSARSPACS